MLEPTRVIVEITMTDEITGRISKTRYRLNQAIYYKNGASEYHAQNADWVYQSLYSAVHAHLKAEGGNDERMDNRPQADRERYRL